MKSLLVILIALTLLLTFEHLFFNGGSLSAGDWPYLYAENIKEFSWLPEARFLWLAPYYQIFTKFLFQIGFSWEIIERVAWLLPFIVISFFSSYKLTKSLLGGLIYTSNTYALMVVGGGQMGVALAYALAPLVLQNFLVLPVQVMFDPRIAAITLAASILYAFFNKTYKSLLLPILLTVIVHLYWIVPFLSGGREFASRLVDATAESVQYLSFGSFSSALSLLHPNWPENIFGKTYFLRPEFLIIPIVAFAGLLYPNRQVLFFSLIGLLGAFLSKGTNEPFGGIYLWLFNNIPGFVVFRDPTKFYLLIAIAYSFLVPETIKRLKKPVLTVIFIVFWVFTIREAVLGQLNGTFQPKPVPAEYIKLKDFLMNNQRFYATAWIPSMQRFAFSSKNHPAIGLQELPQNPADLKKNNVKYVIVPYDSRGEIFLTDRKYDENKYQSFILAMTSVPWLFRVDLFGPIGVFALK